MQVEDPEILFKRSGEKSENKPNFRYYSMFQ